MKTILRILSGLYLIVALHAMSVSKGDCDQCCNSVFRINSTNAGACADGCSAFDCSSQTAEDEQSACEVGAAFRNGTTGEFGNQGYMCQFGFIIPVEITVSLAECVECCYQLLPCQGFDSIDCIGGCSNFLSSGYSCMADELVMSIPSCVVGENFISSGSSPLGNKNVNCISGALQPPAQELCPTLAPTSSPTKTAPATRAPTTLWDSAESPVIDDNPPTLPARINRGGSNDNTAKAAGISVAAIAVAFAAVIVYLNRHKFIKPQKPAPEYETKKLEERRYPEEERVIVS